ncbi:hypothetical protein ACTL6P_19230 [Endozoicomonas acroporae]|uniref:hypothetical protein n=1 Tax=Endozoicomonas acroporae TaxID=1701104 RepID=UPI003F8B1565
MTSQSFRKYCAFSEGNARSCDCDVVGLILHTNESGIVDYRRKAQYLADIPVEIPTLNGMLGLKRSATVGGWNIRRNCR